jgi:acetyl esterase
MKIFGNGEFALTYAQMKFVMGQTFKNATDYNNPLAFPLLVKKFGGLPPMYIAAMGLDPLKDDSIQLANRLQQSGQEYYLTIWPGVAHGALTFIPIT